MATKRGRADGRVVTRLKGTSRLSAKKLNPTDVGRIVARSTESKRLAFGLASFAFVERFLRHWHNKLNPPAPPATYLLIVNPTVRMPSVSLAARAPGGRCFLSRGRIRDQLLLSWSAHHGAERAGRKLPYFLKG